MPATKFSRYENSDSSSESDEEDSDSLSEPNDINSSLLQESADTSDVGIPSESASLIPSCDNNDNNMQQDDEPATSELAATESSDELKRKSLLPSGSGILEQHEPLALQASATSQLSPKIASPILVPVEPESEVKTVGENPPSIHSGSSDESSWSRSPTPIRSPLRLITEPPVPYSGKALPLHRRQQNHDCSSPVASHKSSPKRRVRSPSPVKFQSQLSSKTMRRSDSRSPYQSRRSPVSKWSKSSPKTRVRSSSKSPCLLADSRSPDKLQTRSSAKAPRRSRSRTPTNRKESRSPFKPRISSKEPYRSRSRSPYHRIPPANQSRSSPNVPCRSRSRSPNYKALSGSPSTYHWTRWSPKASDSRSRSPDWRIHSRSPSRRQSRSPGRLRSTGTLLRSSVVSSTSPEKLSSPQQLRLQPKGRSRSPASYISKEGQQTSSSYDKLRLNSPSRIQSPRSKRICLSRSRSKSVENECNSREKSPYEEDRKVQNFSKLNPPCRRYERSHSREGSPRLSSTDRKCSPSTAGARKSPVRLRSRSNERPRPKKNSLPRISKSPVQQRSVSGVKASSYQKPSVRTASKTSLRQAQRLREDYQRSDEIFLRRSPTLVIQPAASHSRSVEKVDKFSDNSVSKMPVMENSSGQQRSKSSERSRNGKSSYVDDGMMKRKQQSDEKDITKDSRCSYSAESTSTIGMKSADKDSFKEHVEGKKSPLESSADKYFKSCDNSLEKRKESAETLRSKHYGKQKGISPQQGCSLLDNSYTTSKRNVKTYSSEPKVVVCSQIDKRSYPAETDDSYSSHRGNASSDNERKQKSTIGVQDCHLVLCAEDDISSTSNKNYKDFNDSSVLDFTLESFEKQSVSSLCDENDDDDEPENKLPRQKHIAERLDPQSADADRNQSKHNWRERRRKRERCTVEKTEHKSVSLSLDASPSRDDRNSATVKSVSSVVKVPGVNQRRAEVFTDSKPVAKPGSRVIQHSAERLPPHVDVLLRVSGDSAIDEQWSVNQGVTLDAVESQFPVRKDVLNTG